MRKLVLILATTIAAAISSGACNDDPDRPPAASSGPNNPVSNAGGGGGTSPDSGVANEGGATQDSGDAGAACTPLENSGAVIDENALNTEIPASTGGVILDGIYNVVEARVYVGLNGVPGPTGTTVQGTIRITGSAFERVIRLRSSAGATAEIRAAGTIVPDNTNGTIDLVCPSVNQEQIAYSVANNSLTLTNLVSKETHVFLKQP